MTVALSDPVTRNWRDDTSAVSPVADAQVTSGRGKGIAGHPCMKTTSKNPPLATVLIRPASFCGLA